jgi:hypothetical protein
VMCPTNRIQFGTIHAMVGRMIAVVVARMVARIVAHVFGRMADVCDFASSSSLGNSHSQMRNQCCNPKTKKQKTTNTRKTRWTLLLFIEILLL